ncbi:flagellar export chaperone FliS [Rubinisphaera margarita]|uniref:flagellar export chaperone FliS n=1 Tax=Rubinisphaera margarita TaxID=2909586 RepID=UPI001EE86B3C|nr:flagellar export chaperone FliS [Rubinisphaera margarita]MCG6157846.1 flagellar export chaperone FliS [Rubinisphaera margarita]
MYEDAYLETQVLTAPGPRLHLMVVEGALRSARQAQAALEQKEFENSHQLLSRSREFVSELIAGLNPEVAPEMVGTLKRLFAYIYRALALADIDHESGHIAEAIRLLESHRDTWLELLEQLPKEMLQSTDPETNWEG